MSTQQMNPETSDPRVAAPGVPPDEAGTHEPADLRDASIDEGGATAALNPVATTVAAFLATAGAGWVVGGVFASGFARLTALAGALIGAALVVLSYRTRRPGTVQLLVVPAALVAGALLVWSDADGDLGELPGFVVEALRSGGLSTPPVPFDPGWRIVVVVLAAALVASAASLAIGSARPRLAVAVPLVVVVGGMLVHPDRGETVTALVALVLVLAGLAVSYGVQLGREGAGSSRFELRRLARGGTVVLVLVVGLAGLSQVGFLFPATGDDQVIPPRRPGVPPAQESRVLFTVKEPKGSDHVWRTGVLDVYGTDENAWLTPPYDPDRFVDLPESGAVPRATASGGAAPAPTGETQQARVTVGDAGGRALPVTGAPVSVAGTPAEYDPRTQTFQATSRLAAGTSYTVASASVDPERLAQAPATLPGSEELAPFLEAPPVPPLVQQLLLGAPPATEGLHARLEWARTKLYENVVAQGAGRPVDVSPDRAQQIIAVKGTKATPYEITAADALLARWVGIPSRIGYGYYTAGQKPDQQGEIAIRPEHGATWLEAYYEGVGWVPVLKTATRTPPPEEAPKSERPGVTASEDRALLVYVPVRVQTVRLAYEVVGYWLLVTLPWVLGVLVVWMWYPAVLKVLRRGRRRRWAHARGYRERIAVAYADLRDVANDFGVGHPTQTPIQFLDAVQADPEHRELAWLVTRALWGDLARDARIDDAEAAEDLARSLRKRLARAQTPILRIFAGISRVSLRDPYTPEIPNLWWRRRPLRAAAAALRWPFGLLRGGFRRTATAGAAGVVVVGMFLFFAGGCTNVLVSGGPPDPERATEPRVPEKIQEFVLLRSPTAEQAYDDLARESLVTDGRVYEIYQGATRQALLQIAWLKSGIDDPDEAKRHMLAAIETGEFVFTRIGEERAYVKQLPDAKFVVWFSPGDRYYQMFVARKDLEMVDLERIVKGLLAFQRADRHQIVNVPDAPAQPDPLLGSAG
ncbi:transglutaminaseTgpA domain-containing protein [Actinopolymorpha sp. B9G3]|uniref:transglutaminaseTgpA domain-containing protein n=1 Tax=Actinopolymorpha sp. B9G3 TaxID=3158970 RepID=UPI0032D9111B